MWVPSFEQTFAPKDALCQVWLKLASGSGEEDKNVKSLRQRWKLTQLDIVSFLL